MFEIDIKVYYNFSKKKEAALDYGRENIAMCEN